MATTLEEQYLETIDKATETVVRLAFKETDWTLCKTSGDMKVYKRPSENMEGRHCFRVDFPVAANYKKTWEVCYPVTHIGDRKLPKATWDTQVDKTVLFELAGNKGELRDDVILVHNFTKPQLKGMVSARDSLTAFKCDKTDKYFIYAWVSVDHPECTPVKKYVRCLAYPCGIMWMPDESDPENKCKCTMIFESDMKVMGVPIGILEAGTPMMLAGYMAGVQNSAQLPYEDLSDLPGMKGPVRTADI